MPLVALLKHNDKIRGIKLPGGQVSLLYQYANDTAVTVGDGKSVIEVLGSVELYGGTSGAKVNMEKSEIM